jgi:hypothetical protein
MAPGKRRTPSEAIAAAVRRGALTASGARRYLNLAADTGQGAAVVARVDQLYGEGKPVTASTPGPADEDEQTWRDIGYADQPPPGPGREPDRLEQVDVRRGYLSSQAAAGDGEPVPSPDHPPMWGVHSHPHSDYGRPAASHEHEHTHRGDNSHRPAPGHGHQPELADQVAAGIEQRAAEHSEAAARQRRIWDMTDDELLDSLGPPPGKW